MKKVAPWAGSLVDLYHECDFWISDWGDIGHTTQLIEFMDRAEGKQIEWCEMNGHRFLRAV